MSVSSRASLGLSYTFTNSQSCWTSLWYLDWSDTYPLDSLACQTSIHILIQIWCFSLSNAGVILLTITITITITTHYQSLVCRRKKASLGLYCLFSDQIKHTRGQTCKSVFRLLICLLFQTHQLVKLVFRHGSRFGDLRLFNAGLSYFVYELTQDYLIRFDDCIRQLLDQSLN